MRKMTPTDIRPNTLRAYVLGVRDGWREPRELSTSHNVEHLDDGRSNVYDNQDRGINLGQVLRSPIRFQRV